MKPAELQTQLKTLRLGGMLHTLELRRAQAEDQRLGHLEFLALLLDHLSREGYSCVIPEDGDLRC